MSTTENEISGDILLRVGSTRDQEPSVATIRTSQKDVDTIQPEEPLEIIVIKESDSDAFCKLQSRESFEMQQPSTSRQNYSKIFIDDDDDDEVSFVTVSSCHQNEEPKSTTQSIAIQSDDVLVFPSDVVVVDTNYQQTPPPPYQSNSRSQRRVGNIGSTPVYQTREPLPQYSQVLPIDVTSTPAYQTTNSGRNWDHYGFDSDSDDYVSGLDFAIRKIRNKFIQRVYTILAIQLLLSFGFVALCIFQKDVRRMVQTAPILYFASFGLFFFVYFILICYKQMRRQFPLNFFLLALLTVAMAYMMGAASSMYSTNVVLASVGMTGGICLLVSLFACQTKYDITTWGMALCLASVVVIIYGIIALILSFFIKSGILFLIYSCLIAVLFIAYLMYDTQQIIGGRRIELSPEEYILGALTLYIDIVEIFLAILQITSYASNS